MRIGFHGLEGPGHLGQADRVDLVGGQVGRRVVADEPGIVRRAVRLGTEADAIGAGGSVRRLDEVGEPGIGGNDVLLDRLLDAREIAWRSASGQSSGSRGTMAQSGLSSAWGLLSERSCVTTLGMTTRGDIRSSAIPCLSVAMIRSAERGKRL